MAEQPGPKVPAPASAAIASSLGDGLFSDIEESDFVSEEEPLASSLPQAARPKDMVRARAARPVVDAVRFMGRAFRRMWRWAVGDRGSRPAATRIARWAAFPEFLGPDRPEPAQATVTTICWMPLEPSGNGVARAAVCCSSRPLTARTARECCPFSAVQGRYHWRQ